jgi:uncharacterized membrane protein YuzA (DUF378 family)
VKKLDLAALVLVIVGGLNWGLVAIAKWDLVAAIAGGLDFGQTYWFSRVVYGLVGVAALMELVPSPRSHAGSGRIPPTPTDQQEEQS